MAIKALINRFNGLRGHAKDKEKEKDLPAAPKGNGFLSNRRPVSSPPAPEMSMRQPVLTPLDTALPPTMEMQESNSNSNSPLPLPSTRDAEEIRHSRSKMSPPSGTQNDNAPKRVAFLSPPPTPGGLVPSASDTEEGGRRRGNSMSGERPAGGGGEVPPKPGPPKAQRTYSNPNQPNDPRQSASTYASVPRGASAAATRGVTSPTLSARNVNVAVNGNGTSEGGAHMAYSLRSGTPYSQMSGRSFVQAAASWSEAAEEDLVSNIGPRERTRQEVLWEIVTSEERYVAELVKMKDTFLEPLLHPFALSPLSSPAIPESDAEDALHHRSPTLPPLSQLSGPSTLSPLPSHLLPSSSRESLDRLPIAARFLGPSSPLLETDLEGGPSSEEGDHVAPFDPLDFRRATVTSSHSRSPYRAGAASTSPRVPFPSRSHQSLPAPPRLAAAASTPSLSARAGTSQDSHLPPLQHGRTTPGARVLRKLQKRSGSDADVSAGISPQALPEDLRECLQVLERGILDGHRALSAALRERYEEQYPLVRSLADVFVAHSHILREYATYVLHLERALEQVDAFLSTNVNKKPKKQDAVEWMRISRILQRLEESAADKGETGLQICLSKPFQRLLKYPLLFQNLLFHTDPSTYEYESTLQMVAEVETIVRSIEDEKILKEERDRTRDVVARIDGLERVKMLAAPKPSRVLIEERLLDAPGPPSPTAASPPPPTSKQVKQKSSFRRLSDVLPGGGGSSAPGGKKDLWLVVFNDVVLRCQRTGVTTLGGGGRPETQAQGKRYGTAGRRNSHNKPRNLYKFVKIETWAIGDVMKPRAGVVSMEDIGRTRAQLTTDVLSDEPEDDGAESDESDRKSKMSFSYWGADKVTVQRTAQPGRGRLPPTASSRRESRANAKFGTRLRTPPEGAMRPASRLQAPGAGTGTTGRRAGTAEESGGRRPAWVSSTAVTRGPSAARRGGAPTPPAPAPAPNAASGASPPVPSNMPVRSIKYSSTAPSEDSGVGLYRQIIAANPSINKLDMM